MASTNRLSPIPHPPTKPVVGNMLSLEDYVLDFIPDCVRCVQRDSGETDVTVIGYCFGGVLSLLETYGLGEAVQPIA